MESSLRGHAAAFQHQQQLQMQNQQYQQQQQQQQQQYRQRSGYNSNNSVGGGHAQDYMSVGSHFSRDSRTSTGSAASSQVDEAYRRLGRRLSIRAHGDGPVRQPVRISRIGLTQSSNFTPYGKDFSKDSRCSDDAQDASSGNKSGSSLLDRTAKVAKTGYSDHGDHHHHKTPSRNSNVLRKMTMNAAELFRLWQADASSSSSRRSKKRSSPKNENNKRSSKSEKGDIPGSAPSDLSPHRFAFSQLALDSSGIPQSASQHAHDQLPANLLGLPDGTGLSAVIESSSQTSSQSNTPNSRSGSVKSRDSSSIPSKSSCTSLRTLPRGKCLTQPSESASNNGLDNVEGNLIAHENDAISVSRKQIHVLTKEKMNVKRADFRIQSLLGQGTFAQVFQCVHVQTGNLVAIKVVKNKPAYTRQAAVEIDVFRALVKGNNEKPVPSSSQSQKLSTSPSGDSVDASVTSKNGGSKWDHMVDLVCYFMHQNHLCLVFELLGLNLYEVLKKRQFRGLPLSVVRTLVKQAVVGVKELSKKNIVHCDLKPENILLVTDDDLDSVVSAGESRRTLNSTKTVTSTSFDKKTGSPHKSRGQFTSSSEKKQGMGDPPTTASGTHKMVTGGPNTPVMADAISQSPANSMGTAGTTNTIGYSLVGQRIKLIDFGSACFEGQTSHTYIQSRFYRSPEVLVGLPYDSAIDMWSLGCVAAELFLGLPILPGVHEHDQLSRICEMISRPSDWMLDQGSKASKYFVKYVPRDGATPDPEGQAGRVTPKMLPQWRVRSQEEYIASLTQSEIRKKGGLAKLEKQPGNRYFKRKRLSEIISHKGQSGSPEDNDSLDLFIHFLYGILDPDPWKRWTATQASHHPFLVGGPVMRKRDKPATLQFSKDENQANIICDIYWQAPWDPNICRRKLLNVQKMREKQQAARRGFNGRNAPPRPSSANSHDGSNNLTHESPMGVGRSPPQHTGVGQVRQQGLGAAMANQGHGGQLSASFTDYANGSVCGDNMSIVSGPLPYSSAALSYNDAGYPSGFLQNSLNEVDFAYALQRPGVVPMGDQSVSSSVDLTNAGLAQLQQQQLIASMGGNNRNHLRTVQRRASSNMTSRSYGDTGDSSVDRRSNLGFAPGSLGTVPGGLGQQISSSMQMSGALEQQAPNSLNQHFASSLGQQFAFGSQGSYTVGASTDSFAQQAMMTQELEQDPMLQAQLQHDPRSMASNLQQQLAYGNAQAYLQQQHAALQQQQILLQQQQAALSLQLQQQQLAYGLSPGMGAQAAPNQNGGQHFGGTNQYAQANQGYYYVTSADGTPMMISAAGLSQAGGFGMRQQVPGFDGTTSNASGQQGLDPRLYHQDPSQYQQGGGM